MVIIGGDIVEVGSRIVFKGEEYKVIWLYQSGYCEIKKKSSLPIVELVSVSELKVLK